MSPPLPGFLPPPIVMTRDQVERATTATTTTEAATKTTAQITAANETSHAATAVSAGTPFLLAGVMPAPKSASLDVESASMRGVVGSGAPRLKGCLSHFKVAVVFFALGFLVGNWWKISPTVG